MSTDRAAGACSLHRPPREKVWRWRTSHTSRRLQLMLGGGFKKTKQNTQFIKNAIVLTTDTLHWQKQITGPSQTSLCICSCHQGSLDNTPLMSTHQTVFPLRTKCCTRKDLEIIPFCFIIFEFYAIIQPQMKRWAKSRLATILKGVKNVSYLISHKFAEGSGV